MRAVPRPGGRGRGHPRRLLGRGSQPAESLRDGQLRGDDGVERARGVSVAGQGERGGGRGGGCVLCWVCEEEEGPFGAWGVLGEEEGEEV